MAVRTLADDQEEKRIIKQCIDDSMLHKELAEGYESVGAEQQEQRELIRGIFLQNQAIILQLARLEIRGR